MSAQAEAAEGAGGAAKGGRRRLPLLALPAVAAALGAGLWFTGVLPGLLGLDEPEAHAAAEGAAPAAPAPPRPPVFFDMPEITANLNVPGRRASYIRLRSKLELSKPEDAAAIQAAMPRLLDLYTTYLREMRPEELRGSAGTQRLREELIARAAIAAAPARVTDVLFTEILVQ
ncbi:flagellar basal body-associated FliL family protein [Paracraurococcus lichenis]|uniref:Flagellar protein FliL n=1 Tax=Paracraurococcus lichenis TaxID=3064888 RepID=A0ABT9DZN0_9PROT|nr:flagellar basal body-associated FliL family protein [Paracraurococcus sp. LOR1-02]MDO9709361.1 flagellar basal body-associated FliL family protein [Paracraurococcus sp. LOR1-02]